MDADGAVCIGVLALQGSFREHVAQLSRISGVKAVEVRTKAQLDGVDGLIIPGGKFVASSRVPCRSSVPQRTCLPISHTFEC